MANVNAWLVSKKSCSLYSVLCVEVCKIFVCLCVLVSLT